MFHKPLKTCSNKLKLFKISGRNTCFWKTCIAYIYIISMPRFVTHCLPWPSHRYLPFADFGNGCLCDLHVSTWPPPYAVQLCLQYYRNKMVVPAKYTLLFIVHKISFLWWSISEPGNKSLWKHSFAQYVEWECLRNLVIIFVNY